MAPARRQRSGEYVRQPSLEERIDRARDLRESAPSHRPSSGLESDRASGDRETSADLLDVPATVVCAFCGDADCGGCENVLSRSGIVSVVAWERPAVPVLTRLWSTARSTTRDTEKFFELLPDGPLTPALRFAATCELLASSAAFLALLAIAALVAPHWLKHLALDPHARSVALRMLVLGLPSFAGLLVIAHAAHGLSINLGATRTGARSARSRALRFGLYACGWDLVMGPIGVVVVPLVEGFHAAARLARSLEGLPTRATTAFLRGCYRLEGERARRARRTSYVGAALATLMFSVIICIAIAKTAFG